MSELEYANDVLLLSEDPAKCKLFPGYLNNGIAMFEMWPGPPNCKMPLQDRIGPKPILIFTWTELLEVDHFLYLRGRIPPSGRTSDEVLSRIQKTQLIFNNSKHL